MSLTKRVRGLFPLRLASSNLKSPTSSFVFTNQVRASFVLFLEKIVIDKIVRTLSFLQNHVFFFTFFYMCFLPFLASAGGLALRVTP